KVLSAIIEFVVPIDKAVPVLKRIRQVAGDIDTVFSLNFICRMEPDNTFPTEKIAQQAGFDISNNGKHNLGLGRPLAQD
ncbi:MAG: 4Fe-4S ferredoxin, partial [Eubacteriales bacterium]